jgi:hypothetical protein
MGSERMDLGSDEGEPVRQATRYMKFPCLCIFWFCSVRSVEESKSINHQTSSLSPSSGRFIVKISDSATASSHHHQSLGLGDDLHPEIRKMGYSSCILRSETGQNRISLSPYCHVSGARREDLRQGDVVEGSQRIKSSKGSSEDRRRSGRKTERGTQGEAISNRLTTLSALEVDRERVRRCLNRLRSLRRLKRKVYSPAGPRVGFPFAT